MSILALAGAASAQPEAEAVGDPDLPWLDNAWYKFHLNVRARIEIADIDGFQNSEAYTLRTRAGVELKPWQGWSALAELEGTWSPWDDQYFDGASNPNGKSVVADPENVELNRAWGQYARKDLFGLPVRTKVKGGRQRIIFDDSRFVGNVGWRQNEQTFDAALGESDFGVDGLEAQYAYLWDIRRIFGNQGPTAASRDFSSDSHLARAHYTMENHEFTAFGYFLDFKNDSPGNSSNTWGVRAVGSFPLSEELALGYSASYAFQQDAKENPADYDAHYVWANLDLKWDGLGLVGVTWEQLGSDDGDGRVVTPLSTAHKFNGFADAFLDNGGPRGLRNLVVTVAPALPWKFKGKIAYHEFWRDDGGGHLGREIDAVFSRPFNRYLSGLVKFGYFDGKSQGPADRWRLTFDLNFKY